MRLATRRNLRRIKKMVGKVDELPPVPGVVTQVLELTSDPNYSMDRLIAVLRLDPGLTAKVLKRCNSSFFGLRYKAESLEQAVPLLGTDNLLELVLSSSLAGYFAGSQDGYRLARGQLWKHSMATALIAQRLCRRFAPPHRAAIYTAALLHDVGKIILSEFVAEEFRKIEYLVTQEGYTMDQAERRVLEMDHAMIGGIAAKKWKLPGSIAQGIAFHHRASRAKKPRLVANLTSLSNYLANRAGADCGLGDDLDPPQTAMWELNLYPRDHDALVEEMTELIAKAAPLLEWAE